ncbi:E4 15 kDa protein [California sea lion adenovirus 1]|uniref:E4 15 kDa protein n=1 Tax=California sea lion adenovirus 1 TaxID=943083 RepID=A0A059XIG1_9ADEN|nr:E4 15 kDa protein [California sea lion adenovirus 1]AIA22371.1 E4 15 kDa protein [California sea lion adenovirus 1]
MAFLLPIHSGFMFHLLAEDKFAPVFPNGECLARALVEMIYGYLNLRLDFESAATGNGSSVYLFCCPQQMFNGSFHILNVFVGTDMFTQHGAREQLVLDCLAFVKGRLAEMYGESPYVEVRMCHNAFPIPFQA